MQPDTNSLNSQKPEGPEDTGVTAPAEAPTAPEAITPSESAEAASTSPEESSSAVESTSGSDLDVPGSAGSASAPDTAPVEPSSVVPNTSEVPPAEQSAASASPESAEVAPAVANDPQPVVVSQPVPTVSSKSASSPRRPWVKLAAIVLAVIIILGGGTAFALFAVIIPNKPESVVVNSVLNSVEQNQVTITGKVNYTSGNVSTLTQFTGATNFKTNATDLQLNVTVSGVSIPAELRLVDKNAYLKFGDLKTVSALVGSLSPDYAPVVSGLAGQLSNKWIEVDSTLLDEMGLSCTLNSSLTFTDADATLLKNMYMQHRFVTATSEGNDTVNGVKATKYSVSLDDNTFAAFAGSLNNLSIMKSLQKCDKNAKPLDTKSIADGDKTPLTIWVDRSSKEVVQLQTSSTAKDAKSGIKGDATLTFNYTKPVNITAPAGAVPAVQLLSNLAQSDPTLGLMLSGLGSAASTDSSSSVQAKSRDTERQTDLRSLQAQLEAYYAEHAAYPSLANLNSASWRSANMQGLDAQALQDPQGSSAVLVATPQAKAYAYQLSGDQHYTLTATLETGSPFVLQSIN